MSKKVRTILEILVAGALLWLLWCIMSCLVREFRSPSTPGMEVALYGAFAGAFAAFLLIQLGTFMNGYIRARLEYFDSLELLDAEMRTRLCTSSNNRFLAKEFSEVFKGVTPSTKPLVFWTTEFLQFPSALEYSPARNRTLSFLLLGFNEDVRKLNVSLATADRTYRLVRAAYERDPSSAVDYVAGVEEVQSMHSQLALFLAQLEADGIAILGVIRMLTEGESALLKLVFRSRRHLPETEANKKRFLATVEAIKKEVAEAKAEDDKRIKKLLSMTSVGQSAPKRKEDDGVSSS